MRPVLFAIAVLTAALGTYLALDVLDASPHAAYGQVIPEN